MDGWLGFNGILSIQVAAIACLQFKMGLKSGRTVRWVDMQRERQRKI